MTEANVNTIQLDIEQGHQFQTTEELKAFLNGFENTIAALLFYEGNPDRMEERTGYCFLFNDFEFDSRAPYTIFRLPEGYSFKQPKPTESKEDETE